MSDTPKTDAARRELSPSHALGYKDVAIMDEQCVGLERELNEANADRLRLREALRDAVDNCLWRSEQPFPLSPEESQRIFDVAVMALDTPPPPVVAMADADSLINQLEQVEETLKGGEIFPPEALMAISKVLKTHREKYPKP